MTRKIGRVKPPAAERSELQFRAELSRLVAEQGKLIAELQRKLESLGSEFDSAQAHAARVSIRELYDAPKDSLSRQIQAATIRARQARQAATWDISLEEWQFLIGENATIIPLDFDMHEAVAQLKKLRARTTHDQEDRPS